jgi:hypothetical protein
MKIAKSVKFASMLISSFLALVVVIQPAWAGLDDCLSVVLDSANPKDMEKAANFVIQHPSCVQNLVPPTVVPYVALSGSLDAANASGALNKVGLGFNSYEQCVAKVDPGKAALKQLAPVLKPICNALQMNCSKFEGPAADEVNTKLSSEVPLLSLLPCACAAANSGLGVQKIAELVSSAKQCGGTLAEAGKIFSAGAKGAYKTGSKVVAAGSKVAGEGAKLVAEIGGLVKDFGCTVGLGGCESQSHKVASSFCKSRGGLSDYTAGPTFMKCKNGDFCDNQDGKGWQCVTAAEFAATLAAFEKMKKEALELKKFNAAWCSDKRESLKGEYGGRCRDKLCEVAMSPTLDRYETECASYVLPAPRFVEYNQGAPHLRTLQGLVVESIKRDPKTAPVELLGLYGCRPFLGREDQTLCERPMAYDPASVEVCKKLVLSGKIKKCQWRDGSSYPLVPSVAAFPSAADSVKKKP